MGSGEEGVRTTRDYLRLLETTQDYLGLLETTWDYLRLLGNIVSQGLIGRGHGNGVRVGVGVGTRGKEGRTYAPEGACIKEGLDAKHQSTVFTRGAMSMFLCTAEHSTTSALPSQRPRKSLTVHYKLAEIQDGRTRVTWSLGATRAPSRELKKLGFAGRSRTCDLSIPTSRLYH